MRYQAIAGNNLSQFGVAAGQLDNGLNTFSIAVSATPTTGEFGALGGFGDFDHDETIATRVGAHYTTSNEDREGQPNTESFDNSQIRLSDGNVIFQTDLFGPGIQIDNAQYHSASADAGLKLRGLSLECGFYWRMVDGFEGPGTSALPFDKLEDTGFQVEASAMLVPRTLQLYAGGASSNGEYGDPSGVRFSINWFPLRERVLRCNAEYLHTDRSPVGALSLPYTVGATGDIVHVNFELDF